MTQNPRCYCRHRIEALADKLCKFGYIYGVRFEHIIVQSANKISYDPLSNLKVTEMKEVHVRKQLYIFFYNMNYMSEFCKYVKL